MASTSLKPAQKMVIFPLLYFVVASTSKQGKDWEGGKTKFKRLLTKVLSNLQKLNDSGTVTKRNSSDNVLHETSGALSNPGVA